MEWAGMEEVCQYMEIMGTPEAIARDYSVFWRKQISQEKNKTASFRHNLG